MPGPDRRSLRARLARCVAVGAVLLGLALLPCGDGMAHGPSPAMATESAMAIGDGDASGPRDLGGVLAACMVFLAAVGVTVLGLRPSWPLILGEVYRSLGAAAGRVVAPRAPSLAKLCLLRT